MTDALKELIEHDDWLGVAKAITFAHVSAPNNPAKYAWVSAVEEGPYHIETNDSAANGGQGFKALCRTAGDFNFHLTAAQIFPSQKCKTCVELASTKVLDVADQGKAQPCIGSLCVGNEGVGGTCAGRHGIGEHPSGLPTAHTGAETQTAQSDSQILDRHGDDRFADNILRALEGLPQNGDAEEEEAAAEEGALTEASGMPDPKFESNGRY